MASAAILSIYGPLNASVKVIADSDETADDLDAHAVLYAVEVDNRNNAAAVYTKLYDASDPTVGTTVPNAVFKTPAGERVLHVLNGSSGWDPATNTTVATVTTGGTGGTTGPTNPVAVRLFTA